MGKKTNDLRELAKLFLTGLAVIVCIGSAIYVGAWIFFVGGVCQVVEGAKLDPADGIQIAIGLSRIFLAPLAGWLTFAIGTLIMALWGLLD
jgi:hypothetical protein